MADVVLHQILHTAGKEPLSTTNGALHTQVKGTDGLTAKTLKTDTDGKLVLSPDSGLATEATLAAINTALDTLNSNVSTEAKLEAVRILVEAISQKDFATETTLAQVLTKLSGDPATATKQDSVKAVLDAISQKDFATETTLAQALEKQDTAKLVLDAISSAVAAAATEQTLTEIRAALTDGTQKVALTGKKAQLKFLQLNRSEPVAAGGVEIIDIRPTEGTIGRMLAITTSVRSVAGASTGTHSVVIRTGVPSILTVCSLTGAYNKWVTFNSSAKNTENASLPDGDAAFLQALSTIRFTGSIPMQLRYQNDTDAEQTASRTFYLLVEEVPITW